MRRYVAFTAAAFMLTAGAFVPAPGAALDDPPGDDPGLADDAVAPVERYIPRPAGTEKAMDFHYGPFHIPPGHDLNRITIDLPLNDGFFTFVAPELVDAVTREPLAEHEAHIHHAHWFRINDDEENAYTWLLDSDLMRRGITWVFGTGEEKTRGDVDARSDVDPEDIRYGIYIPSDEPQALIYMIHNKTAAPLNVYVLLQVRFVYGGAEEIAAAYDCGPLLPGETCAASQTFHPITGRLWGNTYDVPRNWAAYGQGQESVHERQSFTTAPWDGLLIGGAGHVHPGGMEVAVFNLGPQGAGCDPVPLFVSRRFEQVPEAWPYTEEYQMGVTRPEWRAWVRAGDRIMSIGRYRNDEYAYYGAMNHVGIYVDPAQAPPPRAEEAGACALADREPWLIGDPAADPTVTIPNREWEDHDEHPLCGLDDPPYNGPCEREEPDRGEPLDVDTVHMAAFLYLPGDRNLSPPLDAPPRVREGESLRFVNDDGAAIIRHTVTSCRWPCNGPYVYNYPLPDGVFDSGVMGNIDPIDGGGPAQWRLEWHTPTNLEPDFYSYYCRIHPWMRGAFEVVPA